MKTQNNLIFIPSVPRLYIENDSLIVVIQHCGLITRSDPRRKVFKYSCHIQIKRPFPHPRGKVIGEIRGVRRTGVFSLQPVPFSPTPREGAVRAPCRPRDLLLETHNRRSHTNKYASWCNVTCLLWYWQPTTYCHEFHSPTPLQPCQTPHAIKFRARNNTYRCFSPHKKYAITNHGFGRYSRARGRHWIRVYDKFERNGANENAKKRIPVPPFDKYDPFPHTNGNKS